MLDRVLGAVVGLGIWIVVLSAGVLILVFAALDFLPLVQPAPRFQMPDLAERGVALPETAFAPRVPEEAVKAVKTAIVLSGSVKLLIGLAVLLVGVLGLAARLRRGFSGGQAARGTSPVRRWAAICTFAFGIGVALHGVPRQLADLAGSGAHALAGLRIEGTVEDRREIYDPQTGDVRYYLLDVSFSPAQRRLWMKTLKVAAETAGDHQPGHTVALVHPIYDPQDVRLAETLKSPLGVLWPFLWRAVFIFVGVRGIQRNWPAGAPPGSGPGRYAAGGTSVRSTGRTGFGRRGAVR
ncbi:MAG: hypothetical protein CML67_15170 [Rhodobacteraceae bacterium]|nr:hypothetical protein [Paracoccaceae bacterium]